MAPAQLPKLEPQKKPKSQPQPPDQGLPEVLTNPNYVVPDPFGLLARENVFRLEGDDELRRRIMRELYEEEVERRKKDPTQKVNEENYRPPVPRKVGVEIPYQTKAVRLGYPSMQTLLEPGYIVHRRLLFEEQNAERYGWDAGIVQPFLSTAYFYKDVLLWPSKLASQPFERYTTNAGKCLPGDPVPYFLYPPEIGLFGGSVGAAAIIGTVFLFP
jgi:hypothetical protein